MQMRGAGKWRARRTKRTTSATQGPRNDADACFGLDNEPKNAGGEENHHTDDDKHGDDAPRDIECFLGPFVEKETHRNSD